VALPALPLPHQYLRAAHRVRRAPARGAPSKADYFVLSIPLQNGETVLALIVFIGGFSAATAMVIVESLALSTMVMNSLVLPALWSRSAMRGSTR